MAKYSGYGKNAWKTEALISAVMFAVVTVIGIMLYFGYNIVQPVTSQAAMYFDEEDAESARILMSVTAKSGLNVRTKPSTEGDIVLVLKNGEKVEVLSNSSDQWVYIRCIERNDEEGYASSKYLTLVEGNDIGAELDVGTFTDDLYSEKPEDTMEEAKNKEEHSDEYWLMKHGGKLAIAGMIVLLLVSLVTYISSRFSSDSKTYSGENTYSGGKTYSSGNTKGEWRCRHCGSVNAGYVGTCGCGWDKSGETYSRGKTYSIENSYSGSGYQTSHDNPIVIDLDRVAAQAQALYAASYGEYHLTTEDHDILDDMLKNMQDTYGDDWAKDM